MNNKGLTLIELLAVVVIVAVLAAISIPIYTGQMVRARRADAKTSLEQVRAAQEMRRAEYGSYSTDLAALGTSWGAPAARVGDYDIDFTVANANSFTARATPWTGRQQDDDPLYINQDGSKWDEAGKYWPDSDSKWTK